MSLDTTPPSADQFREQLPQVPALILGQWRQELGLYAYVSGQYTSLTYSTVTDYLPSHGLVSVLLTLELSDNWSIQGYGTNLTDKAWRSGQGGNNGNYYFYGPPRQYGARVHYSF